MNPVVKAEWLNGLRKENFVQGEYYLEFNGAQFTCHCVQGVLLKLYERAHPTQPLMKFDSVYRRNYTENPGTITYFNGGRGSLPNAVLAWAGFPIREEHAVEPLRPSEIALLNERDKQLSHLALLNDTGKTFTQLASYIETHF